MHGTAKGLIAAALLAFPLRASDFNGARSLEDTRHAVAFGPRPPGSAALRSLRASVEGQLRALHFRVSEDVFIARTPDGPIEMRNIIATLPGTSGRALVVSGHYDTKKQPGFVGANDGGSSTGFLLELARAVAARHWSSDIVLVWFDGEEAYGKWSDTDSVYGSRHLAERWSHDGTLARVRALINVDMIGDRNLDIVKETNSSPELLQTVWKIAYESGYGRYFTNSEDAIDDDHMPFRERGVNAIDLIDFDYGSSNSWWHTSADTIDKLSEHSFQVVGDVVMRTLETLD